MDLANGQMLSNCAHTNTDTLYSCADTTGGHTVAIAIANAIEMA